MTSTFKVGAKYQVVSKEGSMYHFYDIGTIVTCIANRRFVDERGFKQYLDECHVIPIKDEEDLYV